MSDTPEDITDERPPTSRTSLKMHTSTALRILKRSVQPIGLMGDRMTKAIACIAGCAWHDPLLHFHGLGFDGELGREEWLAPYNDASDVTHRVRLLPQDTWLTRWAAAPSHQARFRAVAETGPIVIAVHDGGLQIGTGYSHDGNKPPMASRAVFSAGSRFEAVTPGAWVAICPLTEVTMTISGLHPAYDQTVTLARALPQNLITAVTLRVADNLR